MDFNSVDVERLRVGENIVVSTAYGGNIPNINNADIASESTQVSVPHHTVRNQ